MTEQQTTSTSITLEGSEQAIADVNKIVAAMFKTFDGYSLQIVFSSILSLLGTVASTSPNHMTEVKGFQKGIADMIKYVETHPELFKKREEVETEAN